MRRACGRMDRAELSALTDGFRHQMGLSPEKRAGFVDEARALDSRLHDRIAASCGNAFLANELSRLKTLFRAFRDVAWEHAGGRNEYARVVEEPHEHLAIVEALAAGDGRLASRAMSRHIMAGACYWSRAPPRVAVSDGNRNGTIGRLARQPLRMPTMSQFCRVREPGHPRRRLALPRLAAPWPPTRPKVRRRSSSTGTSGRSWPRTCFACHGIPDKPPPARPTSGSTAATTR